MSPAAPQAHEHGGGNDRISEHQGAGAVIDVLPFQGMLSSSVHAMDYSNDALIIRRNQPQLKGLGASVACYGCISGCFRQICIETMLRHDDPSHVGPSAACRE